MSGVAAHWFQTYKQTPRFQQWEQFIAALVVEFETDTLRAKTMEVLSLRQSNNVEDYRWAFEQLVCHIRLYDSSVSPTMLTAQFILGLKEELRFPIEMQLTDSVAKATVFASL
jgi:hypothetical protein